MIRNFIFSIFFFTGIIIISLIFLPAFFFPQKVVLVGGKIMGYWAGFCLQFFLSTKIVVKEIKEKKLRLKVTKKKPTIKRVTTTKNSKRYKEYSKKDVGLAKKAISEMQKSKWTSALNISKKAKDKSI